MVRRILTVTVTPREWVGAEVEVIDADEVIDEALDRLADEDRSEWSVAAETQRAVELTELGARLEATTVAAVGDREAAGGWYLGAYDPVSRHCSVTRPLGITRTGDGEVLLSDDRDPPPEGVTGR